MTRLKISIFAVALAILLTFGIYMLDHTTCDDGSDFTFSSSETHLDLSTGPKVVNFEYYPKHSNEYRFSSNPLPPLKIASKKVPGGLEFMRVLSKPPPEETTVISRKKPLIFSLSMSFDRETRLLQIEHLGSVELFPNADGIAEVSITFDPYVPCLTMMDDSVLPRTVMLNISTLPSSDNGAIVP